ncbi:putative amidoligase domain-containing protein [Oceanobacillus chungangensis]|nr:YheC/YheD family protein [Oceanobacillus chungangensis]
MKERFWIESDKELMLQILKLNNVPVIEVMDPRTCVYPIVGRRFGNHNGKDISVIHLMEQTLESEHDFYTKLYSIDKEYRLYVDGLSIKKIERAVAQQAIFEEISIRTAAYGWEWEEVDGDQVPLEWHMVAIRALYVTGYTKGYVKLGILANERAIVVDINPVSMENVDDTEEPKIPFTIGADIEFMLSCDQELLPASTFFPIEGDIGCDDRQIEKDSGEYALVEIRPEKADSPDELHHHIKQLIEKASTMVPYQNIEFRSGSMPFNGYQCGGHLHFGLAPSLSLLRALDHYLAIPIAMIEEPRTAKKRRRTTHGGIGRFRVKSYGFEYISLSSMILESKLTKSILCLAYLVARHHHELQADFLFHPNIQRAYYHANIPVLKKLWQEIKSKLLATSSYLKFKEEIDYLIEMIEHGREIEESSDIRKNWDITVPNASYDTGLIINIPKKMREKFHLKEGEQTFVSAGKNISPATIHAYPFAFRNADTIQLSKSLRSELNLPNNWIPKLTARGSVITLGPIIGILAKKPFDRQTTYFQHLFKLAKEKQMFVYVFEPLDIDWDKQVIRGTTLDGEGTFPFPAVIYDRFLFRGKKKLGYSIDEIRVKLQTIHHIPFINPPALFQLTGNKWSTFQLLSKEHEAYLPETRLLTGANNLIEMLNLYGEVYLKPLDGSLSKGLIRVIRKPSGISLYEFNSSTVQEFKQMDDLILFTSSLIQKTPYLVQEGIRRKRIDGKNIEIRVYMQKSQKKNWLRTGMVTRLTKEEVMNEEFEENVRLSKVMEVLYPNANKRRYRTNELAKAAKAIVLTVEQEIGEFGEIAVDLCIDQYESIKLLEVNAKPDNLFSQIKAYKLRTIAANRLLDYAASLTEYRNEER